MQPGYQGIFKAPQVSIFIKMDYIGLHLTKTSKEQSLRDTGVYSLAEEQPWNGNADIVYPLPVVHS